MIQSIDSSSTVRNRREYHAMESRAKEIRPAEYEDAMVVARTILDAASDEEIGHVSARLHIFLLLYRGGSVCVKRSKNKTICTVSLSKKTSKGLAPDVQSCEIQDPTGEIYSAVNSASGYVSVLIKEFKK